MTPTERETYRRDAALQIYISMTTHMFALKDAGSLHPVYSNVVEFAVKHSVEQADLLIAALEE